MNYEIGDLSCKKFNIPINDYEHILKRHRNQTEWFESSDATTLSYNMERLQSYNIQTNQNQRFINLKKHIEYARSYKGVWSDGQLYV